MKLDRTLVALAAALMLGALSLGARTVRSDSTGPALDLVWQDDGRLIVQGHGFGADEWVSLTVAVRQQSANVTIWPGMVMQFSGQMATTSTVTLRAGGDGSFQLDAGVSTPAGADITATATGDQGSWAEVHVTVEGQ